MIEITHNFDPRQFMWLWAKYVSGFNDQYHCTNSIRGRYSRKFSKHNPGFVTSEIVLMDEQPSGTYSAVYVCGVLKTGYSRKANYPHNVHIAIAPQDGIVAEWSFEGWQLHIRNGALLSIPQRKEDLPSRYQLLPPAYTSCRIFRWSACYFSGHDDETHPAHASARDTQFKQLFLKARTTRKPGGSSV